MIAVSTMVYMMLKPSEALTRLNEMGVEYVELSYDNFQFFRKLGVDYYTLIRDVIDTYRSLKSKVVAAHLPYGDLINRAVNPSEQPKVINELSRWLNFFSEIGVKVVASHIPFNHAGIEESSITYAQRVKEVNQGFFKKLTELGRDYGIVIAVENRYERGVYGYLPKDLIDIVDTINDDYLKYCLDTGHSIINNFQPHEFYKRLHPNVALIHIHDNDGSKDLHLPPYTGVIDWDIFISTLKELNYNGTTVLEVACSDSLRRCDNIVKLLKMILNTF